MTIAVGRRMSGKVHGLPVTQRSVAVGCDFPFCDKALEFPVDIQNTDAKCIEHTIRFMLKNQGSAEIAGWVTNTQKFFCAAHADTIAKRVGI